jgi:hypothetical protein
LKPIGSLRTRVKLQPLRPNPNFRLRCVVPLAAVTDPILSTLQPMIGQIAAQVIPAFADRSGPASDQLERSLPETTDAEHASAERTACRVRLVRQAWATVIWPRPGSRDKLRPDVHSRAGFEHVHGRFQSLPPYWTLRTPSRRVAPLLLPTRSFVINPIGADRCVDPLLDALRRHFVPSDRICYAKRKIYSSFAGYGHHLVRQFKVAKH